ncbi:MAG: hypothetical protein AB1779_06310, partial [Candidatus Thermoplasmatota archaeon]
MQVIFSVASSLKQGIGYTASKQIEILKTKRWLGQLFTLDNIPIDDPNPMVKDNLFDSLASLMTNKADILHSWNGHCLFQMHRAHDLGMKCIVERASTHIEYQYKLLKE